MIIDQYKKMKNLFLRQSYIDAWEDYQRSIRKRSFAQWDYIVLTASNDEQANAFQSHQMNQILEIRYYALGKGYYQR